MIIIRKSCYGGNSPRLGRCGGNSLRLTQYNCLAGSGLQPAPTRYRGGLGRTYFSLELTPKRGGFPSPKLALIRPGVRLVPGRGNPSDFRVGAGSRRVSGTG